MCLLLFCWVRIILKVLLKCSSDVVSVVDRCFVLEMGILRLVSVFFSILFFLGIKVICEIGLGFCLIERFILSGLLCDELVLKLV